VRKDHCSQHREEKRPNHQGGLIPEQQKESKKHGSEELRLLHGLDMNRSGPANLSMRVATGLFVKHHDLLGPVCREVSDAAR
jgi:hypothetical protein